MVKLLIASGGSVNQVDTNIWTPLNTACVYGRVEVVKFSIASGASLNQANNHNVILLCIMPVRMVA